MSTYEPGTVAVATVRGVPNVRIFRLRKAWAYVDPSEQLNPSTYVCIYDAGADQITDVRPLVVLDAPTEGHWPGIIHALRDLGWDEIADQIEAQTKPPKPAEPTGLGAVVEDAEGCRWVRNYSSTSKRFPWTKEQSDYVDGWQNIPAVRVLSEGVTA